MRDFVDLANLTHYPDDCLTMFYCVGLNLHMSAVVWRCSFVEWVQVSNNLLLTAFYVVLLSGLRL